MASLENLSDDELVAVCLESWADSIPAPWPVLYELARRGNTTTKAEVAQSAMAAIGQIVKEWESYFDAYENDPSPHGIDAENP